MCVDVSRSTGAPLELTAAHDGVIVADVVAEWAGRHAQPDRLTLHGPAGGRFAAEPPDGGDAVDGPALDAIEFCRKLSGRAPGSGLLATVVPF